MRNNNTKQLAYLMTDGDFIGALIVVVLVSSLVGFALGGILAWVLP